MNLTEQRDELTLLRSLLEAILEMLPGVQAALIWLVPGTERGQWVEDETRPLPQPMFPVTDWLLAEVAGLNSEAPMRQLDQDGQSYYISSLGILEGRRKAIVIRQPEWILADLRMAQGMIKIHANYARLLFDSERDTLTGLYNRKKMEEKLSELLSARINGFNREQDMGKDDYLAVFDIDHFKHVNDNHGHLIGDEVLLIFAGMVRNALRDVDWVFRYGGEEFVALIKGVSPEIVDVILNRVRVKVQNHPFPQVGQVTVSVGYTPIVSQALPPQVFEEADKALYYAKEHGRNQVCDYPGLVRSGELAPEQHISGSVELF
ncbi:MAG TPA: GGDEF domain-containing protein [Thiobacillus sp.]|nr:GGDEF domain-containing protein [Thiobacillus sp.]